jgi:hypothetical protein
VEAKNEKKFTMQGLGLHASKSGFVNEGNSETIALIYIQVLGLGPAG